MTEMIDRLSAALEGRYRIERELGQGGMATVYLAEDVKHDRKVAVKVLKPELAAVVGGERFLAEIKTTAQLQHPHILFSLGESGGAPLKLVARSTGPDGTLQILVEGPAASFEGSISPDGRWLAYASLETGRPEVFVRPFPDVGRSKTLISLGGGYTPRWAPDGSRLFFMTPQQDLMAVPVEDGGSLAVGSAVRVATRPAMQPAEEPYDVHPSGDRFLTLSMPRQGEDDGRIVVVDNFARELVRRMQEYRR